MQPSPTKYRLLLVDGDSKSLRVLDVSLKKAGFHVVRGGNGVEALAALEAGAPDLIISDTHMPEMDGFELCRRIKQRPEWAKIPFIFLSGRKSMEDKIRGLELGVEDYLSKPIYIKEIVTRVRMLLQRAQRERLESRRDTRTKFAGQLADIAIVDLVQTIEINRKSGIVHIVNRDGRRGAIYFRDGLVIDVEAGRLSGAEALYRLFSWSEGTFEVEFKPIRRKDVIEMAPPALLMEGMRRLDEWTRLLEQMPSLDAVFEVDYHLLANRLADLPDEVNGILRLFDGRRALLQVIEDCDFPDLEALTIIGRLYSDRLLYQTHREHRSTLPGVGPSRLEEWLGEGALGRSVEVGPEGLGTQGDNGAAAGPPMDTFADESRPDQTPTPRPDAIEDKPDPLTGSPWSPAESGNAPAFSLRAKEESARYDVEGGATILFPTQATEAEIRSALAVRTAEMPGPETDSLEKPPVSALAAVLVRASSGMPQASAEGAPASASAAPATSAAALDADARAAHSTEEVEPLRDSLYDRSSLSVTGQYSEDGIEDTLVVAFRKRKRNSTYIVVGASALAMIVTFSVMQMKGPPEAPPEGQPVAATVAPAAAAAAQGQEIPASAPTHAAAPPVDLPAVVPTPVVATKPPANEPAASAAAEGAVPVGDVESLRDRCVKTHKGGRGKYKEVIAACALAAAADAKAVDVLMILANAEFDRGRGKVAIIWAEKAIAIDPNVPEAYVFIGTAQQEAGNTEEAKAAYAKYLELAPKGKYAADVRAIAGTL